MMSNGKPNRPRLKSLAFIVLLLSGLALYCGLAALAYDWIAGAGKAVSLIFHVVAGLAWLFPARLALRWLEQSPIE